MNNKYKLTATALLTIILCGSCSGGDIGSSSKAVGSKSKNLSTGQFEVRVSNGMSFDNNSKGAKVHISSGDMWGLKASGWNLRVAGRKLPDDGSGETNKLEFNNTFLHMMVDINGKKTQVGCKPEKNPEGIVKRTHFDGKTVSGEFKYKLVKCNDYYTGNAVDYPSEPFWVEGEFNNLTVK